MLTSITVLPLFLACAPATEGTGTPSTGTGTGTLPTGTTTGTTTTTPGFPSQYPGGTYRADSLALLDEGEGYDLDDDGLLDNRLPAVLLAADAFVADEDLSVAGLNVTLAAAIEAEDLVLLGEGAYTGGVLTADLLLGAVDATSYVVSVDPASYDDQGVPLSRFVGVFTDETHYAGAADRIALPVTFFPDEPPVLVPVEQARLEGVLDAGSFQGMLGGAVPVDGLVDNVIEPIIPTGDDYDPASYLNMEREELMDLIRSILELEVNATIVLEDGSRGIPAALTVAMSPFVF